MSAVAEFLSGFRGSTRTGLDLLECTPTPALVAEDLVNSDLVPATSLDITHSFHKVVGYAPRQEDLDETAAFLSSFGWLA